MGHDARLPIQIDNTLATAKRRQPVAEEAEEAEAEDMRAALARAGIWCGYTTGGMMDDVGSKWNEEMERRRPVSWRKRGREWSMSRSYICESSMCVCVAVAGRHHGIRGSLCAALGGKMTTGAMTLRRYGPFALRAPRCKTITTRQPSAHMA